MICALFASKHVHPSANFDPELEFKFLDDVYHFKYAFDLDRLISHMEKDKKNENLKIRLILLKNIAEPEISNILNTNQIKEVIKKLNKHNI